ncbi:hypothetical protein D3C72_2029150 [compost metagenome]
MGRALPVVRGGYEILAHGQVGKDVAALGHQPDAALRHLVGGQPADVEAVEGDGAAGGGVQAHHRLHGGGLAHAIASQQGDELAGPDIQVDAE